MYYMGRKEGFYWWFSPGMDKLIFNIHDYIMKNYEIFGTHFGIDFNLKII